MKDGRRTVTYECETCHRSWDVTSAATPTAWSVPRKDTFTPDSEHN